MRSLIPMARRWMARSVLSHALRVLLHVGLPLLIGTGIYLAYRDKEIRLVSWLTGTGVVDVAHSTLGRARLSAVVIGSLPDLAWSWAFGAALMLVWSQKSMREALPWMVGGALTSLASEVGQAFGVVPGTFDVVDLVAIAIGFALGSLLARRASRTSDLTADLAEATD